MGRSATPIEDAKLKALMRLKPTLEDTAAFFECSIRTVERYIRENFDLSFVDFREQHMVHTRLSIVRKAIDKAEKGDNIMLIFCLKNLCQWKDKWDNSDDKKDAPPQLVMSKEQYEDYVKRTLEVRRLKAVPSK